MSCRIRPLLAAGVFGAALTLAAAGCKSLDMNVPRPVSTTIVADETPALADRFTPRIEPGQPETGFRLLPEGTDAFAARALLAQSAVSTLDVQYYMIHADNTGRLLAAQILEAADRGVRVRVLLDDIYAAENDAEIATLDLHPSIEVRLFNPWRYRGSAFARALGFLLEPARLNHRMHNKLYVADNYAMIIGGRNLGDEYFDLEDELNFRDLDVLAVGPVVRQASASFDRYWNSEWAVPAAALGLEAGEADLVRLRAALVAHREKMADSDFVQAVRESDFGREFEAGAVAIGTGRARILGDEPEKVEGGGGEDTIAILEAGLQGHRGEPEREILISSPYFIPGEIATARLAAMVERGVDVRVVTNSLAATDVAIVHSGYARYRPSLLRGGVRLFEFRRVTDQSRERRRNRLFGSEAASLHAKSIVIDRHSVYIGSLNLDPRSVRHNTEVGIVIESPELGERMAAMFEYMMRPEISYEPVLSRGRDSESDAITWMGADDGRLVRYETEPETSWFRRLAVRLARFLPFVEGQL